MKKTIRTVDKERNIIQVTTLDERWYDFPSTNKETGLSEFKFYPSVTWIASYYPKAIEFYKYLANNGWDESEAIKKAAGEKGSRVHHAIETWLKGGEITMETKLLTPGSLKEEELSLEEYICVKSFVDWYTETRPIVSQIELPVINENFGYAGTIDLCCTINEENYIVDFKTGQNIWPEYELQLSAYKHALPQNSRDYKLAVLQLGYRKNKNNWKFTEIEDKFKLFLNAMDTWKNENPDAKPKQRDLPLSLPTKEQLDKSLVEGFKEIKTKKTKN